MRDFGFQIFKALCAAPEKVKEDDKKKKDKDKKKDEKSEEKEEDKVRMLKSIQRTTCLHLWGELWPSNRVLVFESSGACPGSLYRLTAYVKLLIKGAALTLPCLFSMNIKQQQMQC